MARSRNRPRPHLAWLILLALGLLVLAATRVRAAPAGDVAEPREPDSESSEDDAANSGESDPAEAADEGDLVGGRTHDGNQDLAGDRRTRGNHGLDGGGLDPDGLDRDGLDPDGLDRDGVTADDRDDVFADRARHDDDELAEPDRLADMIEDAPLDDPVLRDAIETGVVFASTAFADAAELSDLASRQQRPSRLGRLDLTVAWRRNYHLLPIGVVLGPPIAMRDATTYEPRIDDTFLVIATWRI